MGLRFNPPPGWPPVPEGFVPPPGWQPDPSWPPAPAGWLLWVPDDSVPGQPSSGQETYTQPTSQPPSGGSMPPGQSWPPPGQQAPSSDPTGMPGQAQFGQPGAGQQFGQPSFGQPQFGQPQFGQQQFGQPTLPGQAPYTYPYGGPPATGRANGLAIASFILSLLGFTLITLFLSVIFGIIALVRIRAQPQRGKGLAIAGLVISGLWIVLIGGLIAIGAASSPQRSSGAGQVTRAGTASVFSLRTGDCFQNPSASQALSGVTDVTVVPCTQAHNAQVFAVFPVAGGSSYPGVAALRQQAAKGCRARINDNVDRSQVTNSMTLRYLYPEADSWASGHRAITCLIADSSADMTKSLLR